MGFLRRLWAVFYTTFKYPTGETSGTTDPLPPRRVCPGQTVSGYPYVCIQRGLCDYTGRCGNTGAPLPEGR